MNCRKCNNEINPLRIKALPDTKVCVKCSDTSRWYVRNVISGKTTYCETEVIKDPNVAKEMASMDRRTGWGSNLHKVNR
jgi:ribosomal protein L40E|tara:strand:+ start:417 stop:653 length:237 start_codon:yes stop_codon:yes gene_type:complete